jgi:hypothetical protein
MIKSIAFVAYPSDDVAGTRAWYEGMLGLVFAGAYVEDGVEKYNEAHLGNGSFSLMASASSSKSMTSRLRCVRCARRVSH